MLMLRLRLKLRLMRVWRVNRNVNRVIAAQKPLGSNESVITGSRGREQGRAKYQAVCMQQTAINKGRCQKRATHATMLTRRIIDEHSGVKD